MILKRVREGKLFGFLVCDISLNPLHARKYDKYPVLIKRVQVTADMLSQNQQEMAKKLDKLPEGGSVECLAGVDSAKGYLLTGEHLAFLLSLPEGHVDVQEVHVVAEYTPRAPLKETIEELVRIRRSGDSHPSQKLKASVAKLLANSLYGRFLLNKSKWTKTYIVPARDLAVLVSRPEFRSAVPLLTAEETVQRLREGYSLTVQDERDPDQLYVVEMAYDRITLDSPLHVGCYILSKSKLRNMQAVQFLGDFLLPWLWSTSYCDTDSFCLLLGKKWLSSCVDPQKLEQYLRVERWKWFVPEACEKCRSHWIAARFDEPNLRYEEVDWCQPSCCYEEELKMTRQPGLLKLEMASTKMIALNPKSYIMQGPSGTKYGCKGVPASIADDFEYSTYAQLEEPLSVTMGGIRCRGTALFSYRLTKSGLTPFDKKRVDTGHGTTRNLPG